MNIRIHRLASAFSFGFAVIIASTALGFADDDYKPLYKTGDPLQAGWKMVGPGSITEESPGVLKTEGGMGMHWFAKQTYKDFSLRLEYKLSAKSNNSGVFVRFPKAPETPWDAVNNGYEIQICDEADPEHRTGSVYSFQGPTATPETRPVGDWNVYEITVKGQEFTIKLNGKVVNTYQGSRGKEGYVGIQNHDENSVVRFRNIAIKTLD